VKLDNQTPFAARLLRVQRDPDGPVDGALVLKATFQQDARRRWVPVSEQLPIIDEPLPTAFGIFHGENFMRKDGVDIGVLGTVRLARARRSAEVTVSVGSRRNTLLVYGERRWVRAGRSGLTAAGPELFQEMPLSYERAYGGKTIHDYEEMIWPDNPVGRGYYLSEEVAEGKPLANIESAAARPVSVWSDQAAVAGWGPYPCFWGLRARESVKPPESSDALPLPTISVRLNNNAHPDLIMPVLPQDAEVRISGFRSDEMTYGVPRLGLHLEVKTGNAIVAEPPIEVDGVFVWADLGHVTVTARAHFKYPFNRGEIRSARLLSAGA
jgi:hypothetical protein